MALVLSGMVLIQPAPAAAQDFFRALFGSWGNAPRPQQPLAPAYADPRGSYEPRAYPDRGDDDRGERSAAIQGTGVFCVRTCDGHYFPVPRAGSGPQVAPAKMCNALCPAAQTKVFNGSDIKYAAAQDGTRYSDLPTAFVYRDKIVQGCSCTGNGPGGLAQIDIESDPTLRPGDIVIGADGPKAFKGAAAFPYKSADFTPVDNYARLSADMRRQLSSLEVDATAVSATPVQKLTTIRDEPASRQRQQPAQARAQQQSGGSPFRLW
jgi:hypothetical protein